MDRLGAAFPPALVHDVPFDTTRFVRASIDEVYKTLFIAALLILIVIMVFVQDWRAMLVPATTVPPHARGDQPVFVRNANGDMVPLGTMTAVSYGTGPSLISLYNLRPAAQIPGVPAQDFSSGQALALLGQIACATLPPGMGHEWTGMSYQEKAVGYEAYCVFALALLLVYLALAVQYESWSAPAAVLLVVPIALRHRRRAHPASRCQQPLHPDRSRAADRARQQKRQPDRGVRARSAPPAATRDPGRCGRGRAAALPADPDDLVRVHPRRSALGVRHRRPRQREAVDRHHGGERHARLDLHRGAVRAGVLRRAAALQ